MRSMIKGRIFLPVVGLLLTGCAQYATVREKRPRILPPSPGLGTLVRAERCIADALRRNEKNPQAALLGYIEAIDASSKELVRNPESSEAKRDYNFALSRLFSLISDAKLDPWQQPLKVGEYTLTTPKFPAHQPERNPSLYEFLPADQLDIRGTYMTERKTKPGVGAPLVLRRREARADARAAFDMDRPYYGVTAYAEMVGKRCIITFADPLAAETVRIGGRSFPLAADYSAPLAVMLSETNPKKLELARLLRPEAHAQTARISRLQPYDPNKTVVLVTHGLMDSPATWAPMLNSLRADPGVRANYQFWFYSYPSGYPYPYSASILRHELDAVEKKFQLKKPIVLIGHSMGGLISRLMVTDSGDKIWLSLFGKAPGQTKLSPKARQMLTDSLIFQHRREVGRVIFIAAPHQGSELASNILGRIASKLVRAPSTLLNVGSEARAALTMDKAALKLNTVPNSVDTLAPNNRFVKVVNTIPITPGIPYHSIVGDRGRGDTPNSSDGVVPYWSSHLDGAVSELVVPSGHSAHQNPQAIAEVARILKSYRTR